MATDRLMNHTQGESIVSALQTIAQKSETPYNASNKLPTDYADDTNQTNKFATAAQLEQIELNKNNISSLTANVDITSIISDVTMATGFTLEAQSFLYKQGKHIFGRLIISSTNAYTSSDVEPCTIGTYKPSPHYVAFCGLGADMWKIKSIGYAYISSSSGVFKVNDSGNNSNYTANIPIDYMTA